MLDFTGAARTAESRHCAHVAIQVRDAMVDLLCQAVDPAWGDRLMLSRAYPVDTEELPAIEIKLGDVEQELIDNNGHIAHAIEIQIHCYARSVDDDLDAAVYELVTEVHEALRVDETLGGLVKELLPAGLTEPEPDGEHDQPSATKIANYRAVSLTTSDHTNVV